MASLPSPFLVAAAVAAVDIAVAVAVDIADFLPSSQNLCLYFFF